MSIFSKIREGNKLLKLTEELQSKGNEVREIEKSNDIKYLLKAKYFYKFTKTNTHELEVDSVEEINPSIAETTFCGCNDCFYTLLNSREFVADMDEAVMKAFITKFGELYQNTDGIEYIKRLDVTSMAIYLKEGYTPHEYDIYPRANNRDYILFTRFENIEEQINRIRKPLNSGNEIKDIKASESRVTQVNTTTSTNMNKLSGLANKHVREILANCRNIGLTEQQKSELFDLIIKGLKNSNNNSELVSSTISENPLE